MQAQHLDVFALAARAEARLEEAAQRAEGRIELPSPQRRRLVQGARLLLQQRQIVQRVVDDVAADIGAPMAGDDLGAERDLDPVDIALHHNLLVGVRRRRRVVHQPVAHQGRGRDLARHMLASLEGNRRQIAQGLEIGQQRRRLPPCLQRVEPLKAPRQQPLVQDRQVMHLRDRHHEPAPCRLNQGLDLALVVTLGGSPPPPGRDGQANGRPACGGPDRRSRAPRSAPHRLYPHARSHWPPRRGTRGEPAGRPGPQRGTGHQNSSSLAIAAPSASAWSLAKTISGSTTP